VDHPCFIDENSRIHSSAGKKTKHLDKFLFGNDHLYHGEGIPFDPEGVLSTMTAIVNVVIGYYAGRFIQKCGKGYETLSRLMLTGCLLIFIALCWNIVFPINKKLWSSPFVLLTTGLDLMILSALIYAIEIRNWKRFNWTKFFIVFGKNPLFIYILSEILVTILYMIRVSPSTNSLSWINKVFFPGNSARSFRLFIVCYFLYAYLLAGRFMVI